MNELLLFLKRNLPVVLVAWIIVVGPIWIGIDRLYQNRLEERDAKIRQLQEQLGNPQRKTQEPETAQIVTNSQSEPSMEIVAHPSTVEINEEVSLSIVLSGRDMMHPVKYQWSANLDYYNSLPLGDTKPKPRWDLHWPATVRAW